MHHQWQDIVLAICVLVFNLALIPSIFGRSKPALATSVLNVAFMLAVVTVYFNLHLWYSATMNSINTILWAILAAQKYTSLKTSKHKK
jgi:hypothetical protein